MMVCNACGVVNAPQVCACLLDRERARLAAMERVGEPAAALLERLPRCCGPYGTIGEGNLRAAIGTGKCGRVATFYLANGEDYSQGVCEEHMESALYAARHGVYALPWGAAITALDAALAAARRAGGEP